MIEKLKTINPYDETEIDMDTNSVAGLVYENTPLIQKINELCDAVNILQKNSDRLSCAILDLATPDGENKALKSIQDHYEQGRPVDPYAEQRKYLCKLCWFWNENYEDGVIGVLTGVFDNADRPFERNIDQTLYKHCEPVKPDDDIIYKGGDLLALETELERTRKALEVAVDALKIIGSGKVIEHSIMFHEDDNKIFIANKALEQITAQEQKDK